MCSFDTSKHSYADIVNYITNAGTKATNQQAETTGNGVRFGNILVVSASFDLFLNKVNIKAQTVLSDKDLLTFAEALSSMEHCLTSNTSLSLPSPAKGAPHPEYADDDDNETNDGRGQPDEAEQTIDMLLPGKG